jgi:glycosyltransferase involved in cell wall biosynthesis
MKLKVLQLLKTSDGGEWALRQMRELVKLGVEVHVALPLGGSLIPEYKAAGITIHPLQADFPMRQIWRCPQVLTQLRDLVSRIEPDVIHSHFVGTTLSMRLALGKNHPIPRFFQVPGPLHLEHPLTRYGEILTAGSSDYWIGSCEWTCKLYNQSGIPLERLFLSYYGDILDEFVVHKKGKLRSCLGVDEKVKLIGMVAYMYPPKYFLGQTRGLKGHEDLIDGLAICRKKEPNILGVFIGGAWGDANAQAYENRVRVYAQKHCPDSTIFLGTRNDVLELYPDLDVAVHPSHSENVGAADESLLLGVPTIATNIGGFPDLIKHGKTGWLVPPKAPQKLAEAILEALADPVRANIQAIQGQQLTKQLFDVKQTARQVLEIYQTVLSQRVVDYRQQPLTQT